MNMQTSFINTDMGQVDSSEDPDYTQSVVFGRDTDVLPILIRLHSSVADPQILDCTYNKGVMWKGLRYNVASLDIDPRHGTDYVGDCRDMAFIDRHFDILVFDPPHLPTAAATTGSSNVWRERYGITDQEGMGRDGDNVSEMFLPFLHSAKSVLRHGGIILAKLADLTHNHRYQWQHVDFIQAAQLAGMTPCDLLIKIDPSAGQMQSGKWQHPKHFRKTHCYWIVIRNSTRCERH